MKKVDIQPHFSYTSPIKKRVLITDWEVSGETPPDNIHLVMNMISQE